MPDFLKEWLGSLTPMQKEELSDWLETSVNDSDCFDAIIETIAERS